MDAEASKTNGIQGQNSVPNSEGYFAEAESLEETENVPSLQILGSRTEESTEKSRQFEYDGLNFQNMSIADLSEREFAKVEEAERFYCNYALAIGFSIRRSRLRRSEGGVVMGRQWVCSKEGSRSKKWTNRDDMVRTPRKETRENCHATFAVKYCPNQDAYIVTKFVKEHSHRLANSHEVPFLRSHWCVTESNVAQSMSMRKASIKTNRTYDYMVDQAGGYKKVGFTSKDLYNRMDFERRQVVLDGDAQAAISYMNGKAIADPEFFCMFSVDEENRLANLFWRDSQSLHDYCCFGDVVILDSTYKTNVYDKPLVVFVGVNNHNATTVFGCAFLVDETADTYRWVLRTFLTSMKDKKPVSIVTDGDDAMRVAIDEVFPDAHHRLCTWHIMRNVNTNVNNPEIVREFSYCVHGGLTPVAFEQHWQQMIDTYDLKGDWIEMMYRKRYHAYEESCIFSCLQDFPTH